jgi:hypothetical protein
MSSYCPLKQYKDERHSVLLKKVMENTRGTPVCFIGDETGFFFSTCRNINYPSISFTNKMSFIFYSLLKHDVYSLIEGFSNYMDRYDPKLIEIFEKEIYTDKDIMIMSFKLFILYNSSQNIDDTLSDYLEYDVEFLKYKISRFDTCYLENNRILLDEIPKNNFMICHNTAPVGNRGILITTKNHDYHVISEIDDYKYYYYQQ